MNALAAHLPDAAGLIARRAGILTYQSPVVYMRVDCEICRSEGFEAQTRVEIDWEGRTVIATVLDGATMAFQLSKPNGIDKIAFGVEQ